MASNKMKIKIQVHTRMSDRLYEWLQEAHHGVGKKINGDRSIYYLLPEKIKTDKTTTSYFNEFADWIVENINIEHEIRNK